MKIELNNSGHFTPGLILTAESDLDTVTLHDLWKSSIKYNVDGWCEHEKGPDSPYKVVELGLWSGQ